MQSPLVSASRRSRLGGGTGRFSGTSAASPFAAGAAALLAQQDHSAADIAEALRETAVDAELSDLSQGAGRIDAWAALHGSERSRLVNTETDDEGRVTDFDIWVRANTMRGDDLLTAEQPYFLVHAREDGGWTEIYDTGEVEASYDMRHTIEVPQEQLLRIDESGEVVVRVRLHNYNMFSLDDTLGEWTLSVEVAPSESQVSQLFEKWFDD